jgi:threonine dehydratase
VRGVIAATTGNHGQSIAFAAKLNGLRAVIVVPHGNNPEKNTAMRSLGAGTHRAWREVSGGAWSFPANLLPKRACMRCRRFIPGSCVAFHPCSWRRMRWRCFARWANWMPSLCRLASAPAFAAVAAAKEALGLKTKIIGVVSEHAPAYALSFQQRQFVEQSSTTRVAEGVACKTPNKDALEHVIRHAHEIVTVNDDEAVTAMREIIQSNAQHRRRRGCAGLRGAEEASRSWQGKRVACVLTGGNASMGMLREALQTK